MAFIKSNASAKTTKSGDTSWKAQAFLNVFLPSANGSRKKLGALPLKASKEFDADLINWLDANAEGFDERMDKLLSRIQLQYTKAEDDSNGFALCSGVEMEVTEEAADANKAQAFLNFYVLLKNGKYHKLGGVPLRSINVYQRQLMAWLEDDSVEGFDTGARLAMLKEQAEYEFRLAEAYGVSKFSL